MPQQETGERKGLRIDLALECPSTGDTKWIDVSAVHRSSPSYHQKEIKFVLDKRLSYDLAVDFKLPDPLAALPGPSVLERERTKIDKYSCLVSIAKKQFHERKRMKPPSFCPFVVSDTGEFGPSALQLQEHLVHTFKARCVASGPRADGCALNDIVHNFRHRFKVAIQCRRWRSRSIALCW